MIKLTEEKIRGTQEERLEGFIELVRGNDPAANMALAMLYGGSMDEIFLYYRKLYQEEQHIQTTLN